LQLAVVVIVVLLALHEEPWKTLGEGRHSFVVVPELDGRPPSDQLFSVQSNSFFVALTSTDQLETRCGDNLDEFCSVAGSSNSTDLSEVSKKVKFGVRANFEPFEHVAETSSAVQSLRDDGKRAVFTSDHSFDVDVDELVSRLAKAEGQAPDKWLATVVSEGAEAFLHYHWSCEDRGGLALDGCKTEVELGVLSSSHGFQMKGSAQPTASKEGGVAWRRPHLVGLKVHLRGSGGLEGMSIITILNVIMQFVAFTLLITQLVCVLSLTVFDGSTRRTTRITENYIEEVHARIAKIVTMKKADQPALSGLSDTTLHAKLVDDIETLCGFALDGKSKSDKVDNVLDALYRHAGSVHKVALELGEDNIGGIKLSTLAGATTKKKPKTDDASK
jgi:predicted small metal-binding protein